MYNENVYKTGIEVEELGFLVVTPDQLGVTDSIDDVVAVLGHYLDRPDVVIKVIPGEKKHLLETAHKIMCTDNILAMQGGVFNYPALPEANALISRTTQDKNDVMHAIIHRF